MIADNELMEELANIIELAQRGDDHAFAEIVHRFQNMAVGYGYAQIGDFHLAEEAAQEAFVQIYRDLPQLRQPRAFPSWFRTVIHKQCDRITRRKQITMVELRAAATVPDRIGIADQIEINELQQAIRAVLLTLPEAQRQTVTLFYIGEYSQREIADFLNLPLTTVKKRIHDAKIRLKARMMEMAQEYLYGQRPSQNDQFVGRVLEIIAPNRQADEEQIYSLFELARHPDTFQWRAGRLAQSHVDWQSSRIAVLRSGKQEQSSNTPEMIGALHVYDIAMNIGAARVRTAGYNCEVTHPAHAEDRLTLLGHMIDSSLTTLREQGYDLALAFDDEAFWLARGFVLGWRALQWHIAATDLPTAAPLTLHRFEPHDRDDLAQLYNAMHQNLTGTAERPTYLRNKHPGMFMGWYWCHTNGQPVGYISGGGDRHFSFDVNLQTELNQGIISEQLRHQFTAGSQWENEPLSKTARCTVQQLGSQWLIEDGSRRCFIYREGEQLQAILFDRPLFWVDEVAGDPTLVLQALGQLARQWQCTELFFDRLHYKSSVGKRLRQMISCRIHTGTYSRSARSYVVRIINLQSLFGKLTSELTRRLQASAYATWQGTLTIVLEQNGVSEEITLTIDKGVVSLTSVGETEHTIRGGQALAQLIVGSEAPTEVVEMGDIEVSGDARILLPVLFPSQWPQMGNQGL